jgi:hypothetical protein
VSSLLAAGQVMLLPQVYLARISPERYNSRKAAILPSRSFPGSSSDFCRMAAASLFQTAVRLVFRISQV